MRLLAAGMVVAIEWSARGRGGRVEFTSASRVGAIEYRYANYDVARAEADYRAVADEIAALQLELDLVNQTEVFSVEL